MLRRPRRQPRPLGENFGPRALGLAGHRDLPIDRNAKIPVGLPAVWAALGQVTRAEALATSITIPYQ